MKKLITTIGLGMVITLSSVTFAQDKQGKQNRPTKEEKKNMSVEEKSKLKTDRMTKQLELSEDQSKQVYDINLKHEKENKILQAEAKIIKEKRKASREEKRENLEKVLTPEQLDKAKEMEAARKENHKKGGKGGPKHGREQAPK
jgi:Spy/CpxP family protein refolding chaperone